jgi:hypothetical protein
VGWEPAAYWQAGGEGPYTAFPPFSSLLMKSKDVGKGPVLTINSPGPAKLFSYL